MMNKLLVPLLFFSTILISYGEELKPLIPLKDEGKKPLINCMRTDRDLTESERKKCLEEVRRYQTLGLLGDLIRNGGGGVIDSGGSFGHCIGKPECDRRRVTIPLRPRLTVRDYQKIVNHHGDEIGTKLEIDLNGHNSQVIEGPNGIHLNKEVFNHLDLQIKSSCISNTGSSLTVKSNCYNIGD